MKNVLAKVVMLPTEKAIDYAPIMQEQDGTLFKVNEFGNRHLYFTTDEEIKNCDHFIVRVFGKNQIQTWDESYTQDYKETNHPVYKTCKKIVASTDESLGLPTPSNDFLKSYCEQGDINEVLLEEIF